MLEMCMAAVLVGVMRRDSWAARLMVRSAWYVSCAFLRPFVLILGVSCLSWSLTEPGVWRILRAPQSPPLAVNAQQFPQEEHT